MPESNDYKQGADAFFKANAQKVQEQTGGDAKQVSPSVVSTKPEAKVDAEKLMKKAQEQTPIKGNPLIDNAFSDQIGLYYQKLKAGDYEGVTTKYNDYGKYSIDSNFSIDTSTTQEELNNKRAQAQGAWSEASNAIGGAIVKAPVYLAKSMADFGNFWISDFDNAKDTVLGRSSDTLKEMGEEAGDYFKVFKSDNNGFFSRENFAGSLVQDGGAYAIGFMTMGAGLAKLAGAGEAMATKTLVDSAKGLTAASRFLQGTNYAMAAKRAQVASEWVTKTLPHLQNAIKGASTLGQAAVLTELEGASIGYDLYNQVYKDKYEAYAEGLGVAPEDLDEGQQILAHNYANEIARNAGEVATQANRAAFIFNMSGLKYFTKTAHSADKVAYMGLKKLGLDFGSEVVQEGLEETLGGVAEKTGQLQADKNLTKKTGGDIFGDHEGWVEKTMSHVFSQEGLEEFLSGAVMGGFFAGGATAKMYIKGEVQANNKKYKEQQAMMDESGLLKDLYNPKSEVLKTITNVQELEAVQAQTIRDIEYAEGKGDTQTAENLRAKMLTFQAYDYFEKGMGDVLVNTLGAIAENPEQARELYGENYQANIAKATEIIKDAQEQYDIHKGLSSPATAKLLYQTAINRVNISKALDEARVAQAKAQAEYTRDLANGAFNSGPSIETLGSMSPSEYQEFKAREDANIPQSLKELEFAKKRLNTLQGAYRQTLNMFSDITSGAYEQKQQSRKDAIIAEQAQRKETTFKEAVVAKNTVDQKAKAVANDVVDPETPTTSQDVDSKVQEQLDAIDAQIEAAIAQQDYDALEELGNQREAILAQSQNIKEKIVEATTNVDENKEDTTEPVVETTVDQPVTVESIVSKFKPVIESALKKGDVLYNIDNQGDVTGTYVVKAFSTTGKGSEQYLKGVLLENLETGDETWWNSRDRFTWNNLFTSNPEFKEVLSSETPTTEEIIEEDDSDEVKEEVAKILAEIEKAGIVLGEKSGPSKLVDAPNTISVRTKDYDQDASGHAVSRSDASLSTVASAEQAYNILSPEGVQEGTNLTVEPRLWNNKEGAPEIAYALLNESGALVGYLHKPDYLKITRVAIENALDVKALAYQRLKLRQTWANLNGHFGISDKSSPAEIEKAKTKAQVSTIVYSKRPGSQVFVTQSSVAKLLEDERVELVVIRNGVGSVNNMSLEDYLSSKGATMESFDFSTEDGPINSEVVLVPTSVVKNGKTIYTWNFANRTKLTSNPSVLALVRDVVTRYLTTDSVGSSELSFVEDILSQNVDFGATSKGVKSVKIGNSLFYANNLGLIESTLNQNNVYVKMPYSNNTVVINGVEVSPRELIGSTFTSKASSFKVTNSNGDTLTSYFHNPVVEFVDFKFETKESTEVVQEEVKKKPRKGTLMKSPLPVKKNVILELESLGKEVSLLEREEIARSLSANIFSIAQNNPNVQEVLKAMKEELMGNIEYYQYFVDNGVEQEDINEGVSPLKEDNEKIVKYLTYTVNNFDTLSNYAISLLKEKGLKIAKNKIVKDEEVKDPEMAEAVNADDTQDVEDKDENSTSEKYNESMFERNPYEVSTAEVRMFFDTIGSGAKSLIGTAQIYGGKKLFMETMRLCADKLMNRDNFVKILRTKGLPHFVNLAEAFNNLPSEMKNQVIKAMSITKSAFRNVKDEVFDSNRYSKELLFKGELVDTIKKLYSENIDFTVSFTIKGQEAYDKAKAMYSSETERNSKKLVDSESLVTMFGWLGYPIDAETAKKVIANGRRVTRYDLAKAIVTQLEDGLTKKQVANIKLDFRLQQIAIGGETNDSLRMHEVLIESDGDSIVSVEGKRLFPYGIHHNTSLTIAKLNDPIEGPKMRTQLRQVPFLKYNELLLRTDKLKVVNMDGADGKIYSNMTTDEKNIAKFKFYKKSRGKDYPFFSSAKSDKSSVIGLELTKLTSKNLNSVVQVIQAEMLRYNQFANGGKIEGVNGERFYLFEELNDMDIFTEVLVGDKKVKVVDQDHFIAGGSKLIRQLAIDVVRAEVGRLSKTLTGIEGWEKLKETRLEDYNEVVGFVVSEIAHNYDFMLISGDPAFFAKGTVAKTHNNYFKRLTRDIATATRSVGDIETQPMKIITLTEPEGEVKTSKNIEQIEEILGAQVDEKGKPAGYRKVEVADAQGYCSIEEYFRLLAGEGTISEERRDALLAKVENTWKANGSLKELEFTSEELEGILIKPRKPVTIGNKVENYMSAGVETSVSRPVYVKYSIMPLLPQLFAEDDSMLNLIDGMKANGVDRAVYESGFKVGSKKTVDADKFNKGVTLGDESITTVDRMEDGNQLNILFDESKNAILQGTQLLKLIFDGVQDGDLVSVFYDNQAELFKILGEKHFADMGVTIEKGRFKGLDIKTFRNYLQDSMADFLENPNEANSFKLKDGGFEMPLFFNKLGAKIESVLMLDFKKKILKTKLAGRSFVLVSEHLFGGKSKAIAKVKGYDPSKGLLPARLVDSKGNLATPEQIKAYEIDPVNNPLTVKGAQVMVPWNFKDKDGNVVPMEPFTKDGVIDMDLIDPALLEMVGYRIPTQGHNSMAKCEIVGFLPAYMGDTIIAPKDWTVQMGSDFDIDKVFMHFKYHTLEDGKLVVNNKDEKSVQNNIVDVYLKTLSKYEVFKRQLTPLDFGKLPEIVEKLKKLERFQDSTNSILLPTTQVTNYETGTAGKIGVGMSSLLSVFSSIVQNKNLSVKKGITVVKGDKKWDLSDISSATQFEDKSKTKNSVISAFQSASVDNIKELLVKTINYNSDTHPLLVSMSLLGFEEEAIVNMMVLNGLPDTSEPTGDLNLDLLEQAVMKPDSVNVDQLMQLSRYKNLLLNMGNELSNLAKVVNFTTDGLGMTIEDLSANSELIASIEMNPVVNNQDALLKHMFWGKGKEYFLQLRDIMGDVFPVKTKLYTSVMTKGMALSYNGSKKFRREIKNSVKSYFYNRAKSIVSGAGADAERARLFFGDSLSKRGLELRFMYPKNIVLKSLVFNKGSEGYPDIIQYVGTSKTASEKYLWQQELIEMYNSEDDTLHAFAKDFIKYQYLAGGVQTPGSAIQMLPPALISEIGLTEEMRDIDWSENEQVSAEILEEFIANNLDNKNLSFKATPLKDVKLTPKGNYFTSDVKVAAFSKSVPEYIGSEMVGTRTVYYFYTHSQGANHFYKNIEPKGKFGMKEYGTAQAQKPLAPSEVFFNYNADIQIKMKNVFNKEELSVLEGFDFSGVTVQRGPKKQELGAEGTYNTETKVITVASDLSEADFKRVLAHELLHAALSDKINMFESYKQGGEHTLTQDEIVVLRKLDALFKFAQSKGGPESRPNTVTNLHEFMSDMLTQPESQVWASSTEFNNKTIFQRFKELVKDLVFTIYKKFFKTQFNNVDVKESSLLEQFLSDYLILQETMNNKRVSVPLYKGVSAVDYQAVVTNDAEFDKLLAKLEESNLINRICSR